MVTGAIASGWWAIGWSVDLSVSSRSRLFTSPGEGALTFDYFVGDGVWIAIQMTSRLEGREYKYRVLDPTLGRWTHAEIPLSKFTTAGFNQPPGDPLPPNLPVFRLHFQGGVVGGGPFYIDNIKILRGGNP
jgi:hypothetical protein